MVVGAVGRPGSALRELSGDSLAEALRPFDVNPVQITIDGTNRRGYLVSPATHPLPGSGQVVPLAAGETCPEQAGSRVAPTLGGVGHSLAPPRNPGRSGGTLTRGATAVLVIAMILAILAAAATKRRRRRWRGRRRGRSDGVLAVLVVGALIGATATGAALIRTVVTVIVHTLTTLGGLFH